MTLLEGDLSDPEIKRLNLHLHRIERMSCGELARRTFFITPGLPKRG